MPNELARPVSTEILSPPTRPDAEKPGSATDCPKYDVPPEAVTTTGAGVMVPDPVRLVAESV
jgi:hypothetical protein